MHIFLILLVLVLAYQPFDLANFLIDLNCKLLINFNHALNVCYISHLCCGGVKEWEGLPLQGGWAHSKRSDIQEELSVAQIGLGIWSECLLDVPPSPREKSPKQTQETLEGELRLSCCIRLSWTRGEEGLDLSTYKTTVCLDCVWLYPVMGIQKVSRKMSC